MTDFTLQVRPKGKPNRFPLDAMTAVGDYFDVIDTPRDTIRVTCSKDWQGTANRRFATFTIGGGGSRVMVVDIKPEER